MLGTFGAGRTGDAARLVGAAEWRTSASDLHISTKSVRAQDAILLLREGQRAGLEVAFRKYRRRAMGSERLSAFRSIAEARENAWQ